MKAKMIIPVEYKGEQLLFEAKLQEGSFGYKLKVKVDGGEVVLEPDQEGTYQASVKPAKLVREGKVDVAFVEGIRRVVEEAGKE